MEEKREEVSIDQSGVDDILNYFVKMAPSAWDVRGANPSYIKSFHDWFCALDEILDRLRGVLTT